MSTHSFNLEEFIDSSKPWHYLDQCGLSEEVFQIAPTQVSALEERLGELDEIHVAYALVIGRRVDPNRFAMYAATLLDNNSQSVRLNAYNLLCDLKCEGFSAELRQRIENTIERCPEKQHFADLLGRS